MDAIAINAIIAGTFMLLGHLIRLQSAKDDAERAQIMLEMEAQAKANEARLNALSLELKAAADEARAFLASRTPA